MDLSKIIGKDYCNQNIEYFQEERLSLIRNLSGHSDGRHDVTHIYKFQKYLGKLESQTTFHVRGTTPDQRAGRSSETSSSKRVKAKIYISKRKQDE